jgi:hypothetical protein
MKKNEASTPGRVRVVVVYEDYDAGKRAHLACQQILQTAHLDQELSPDFWKFEMFKLRGMRDSAVEEAAGADLLMLALHDGSMLPDGVQGWIQASLKHPRRPKSLVVLLGPDSENVVEPPPVAGRLQALAVQLRIPFWCLQLELPSRAWSEPIYALTDLEGVAQAVFAPRTASSILSPSACKKNGAES